MIKAVRTKIDWVLAKDNLARHDVDGKHAESRSVAGDCSAAPTRAGRLATSYLV